MTREERKKLLLENNFHIFPLAHKSQNSAASLKWMALFKWLSGINVSLPRPVPMAVC